MGQKESKNQYFYYTKQPNIVIPSGEYSIIPSGGELGSFADKRFEYKKSVKDIISGADLSIGNRLLFKTKNNRFVFAEILSADRAKLELAYIVSGNEKN